MSGPTLQRTVTIVNPQGFHMRPAAEFARLASAFQSQVTLAKEDLRVNGKSLLDLILLVAVPGTQLTLEVSGPDAAVAIEALAELLAAPAVNESDEPTAPTNPSVPQKG